MIVHQSRGCCPTASRAFSCHFPHHETSNTFRSQVCYVKPPHQLWLSRLNLLAIPIENNTNLKHPKSFPLWQDISYNYLNDSNYFYKWTQISIGKFYANHVHFWWCATNSPTLRYPLPSKIDAELESKVIQDLCPFYRSLHWKSKAVSEASSEVVKKCPLVVNFLWLLQFFSPALI